MFVAEWVRVIGRYLAANNSKTENPKNPTSVDGHLHMIGSRQRLLQTVAGKVVIWDLKKQMGVKMNLTLTLFK